MIMDTSSSISDGLIKRRRNRILPSAEDIYICLTNEQLDIIGRSRLLQDDTEYASVKNSNPDTLPMPVPYRYKGKLRSAKVAEDVSLPKHNAIDGSKRKKVIRPEPELSNPHHIPFYIRDYEENYDLIQSGTCRPYLFPENASWSGAFLLYSAIQNSVDIVAMSRVFQVHKTDSLFENVFRKIVSMKD